MTTRRHFLAGSLAVLAGAAVPPRRRFGIFTRRGEKLRVGVIGVANRGRDNLNQMRDEEIVALCDVDARYLETAIREVARSARGYRDYREMLAKEDLDAVVVSTPDHHHAPATALALRRGLHVYCEKPLAHTVHEARVLAAVARDSGLVTQVGTQIHSRPNYHRVVEAIRVGAVGTVEEVHVFCDKSWSGVDRPKELPPVPEDLDFDLWLGPAPERPFHPHLHPEQWRRWWDFGGGTLADMGCHYLDLVHWALDLRGPRVVSAEGPAPDPRGAPERLHVRWEHAPGEGRGPVTVHWYDGGWRPQDLLEERGLSDWSNGVRFLGEAGYLIADYDRHVLGPEARAQEFTPPAPWIPDSTGHHKDWLAAIHAGSGSTSCSFEDAGTLAETVLLGIVAFRAGKPITWDAALGRVVDCPEAEKLLHYEYRSGWTL